MAKRPQIPGAVSHRKRFKAQKKAGLVQTTPKSVTKHVPPPTQLPQTKRPNPAKRPFRSGPSLAEQLGLKVTPTPPMPKAVREAQTAPAAPPPPPEPAVMPEAVPQEPVADTPVEPDDAMESLITEPAVDATVPQEPVNVAEELPSSDIDAAEAAFGGDDEEDDEEQPEA